VKPDREKETAHAWKGACVNMIRNCFESDLTYTPTHAKYVMDVMGPMIGHTEAVAAHHYIKPPIKALPRCTGTGTDLIICL
jgi:hypothetical protein